MAAVRSLRLGRHSDCRQADGRAEAVAFSERSGRPPFGSVTEQHSDVEDRSTTMVAYRSRVSSPVNAVLLGVLLVLLMAAAVVLEVVTLNNLHYGVNAIIELGFGTVGLVVELRLPRNPIGWLLLISSVRVCSATTPSSTQCSGSHNSSRL